MNIIEYMKVSVPFPYHDLALVLQPLRNVGRLKVHQTADQRDAAVALLPHQIQGQVAGVLGAHVNVVARLGQHLRRALHRVAVHVYPEAVHQEHIDGGLACLCERGLLLGAEQKAAQQLRFGEDGILAEQLDVALDGVPPELDLVRRQRQQLLAGERGQGERGQRAAQLLIETVQLLVAHAAVERAIDVDVEALGAQ